MFNFKKFFCNCLLSLYEHISGFSISGEISRKNAEISELKSRVSKLESDVSELNSEVSELESEVSELISEVSELKSEIKEKDNKIVNLKSDKKFLKEQVIKNSEDFIEETYIFSCKVENLSKANSELEKLNKTKSSSITRKD